MSTSWEIERRYLVTVQTEGWTAAGPGRRYRQGYLLTGPASVRIRSGEERGWVLTCKKGSGVRRMEVEAVVPPDVGQALLDAAGEKVIEKVRYVIGPWELDRFVGSLDGLALLEIELHAENDPIPAYPSFVSILREVTLDTQFTSSYLASLTSHERAAWVREMYANRDGIES